MERAGYAGTDSAWARSWLTWGVATDTPRERCIVVLDRGAGAGHVGFFVMGTATEIRLLGGKQGDLVGERRIRSGWWAIACRADRITAGDRAS